MKYSIFIALFFLQFTYSAAINPVMEISLIDSSIENKLNIESTHSNIITPVLNSDIGSGFVITSDLLTDLSKESISLLNRFDIIVIVFEKKYWNIYGVKFSHIEEFVMVGAILNLDQLIDEGHIIYEINLSHEEMFQIIQIFN
jgi:hypothetical protein